MQCLQPGYAVSPLLSPPPNGCQPRIVFWCFFRPTIELYSQQPKQTFVISYASRHFFSPSPSYRRHFLSQLCLFPVLTLPLHSVTSIQHEDMSGHKPPCCKWCHKWLPLFIKLTQARLRSRPLPALGPAHYSQYLHAILNCWEFPWWWEPPLHEIFRARGDSREAQRRVFTPIWLYDMIFSWAMTVLLN